MRRIAAVLVIASALVLTGCGMSLDDRVKLLKACTAAGGSYTEAPNGFGRCETEGQEKR